MSRKKSDRLQTEARKLADTIQSRATILTRESVPSGIRSNPSWCGRDTQRHGLILEGVEDVCESLRRALISTRQFAFAVRDHFRFEFIEIEPTEDLERWEGEGGR